RTYASRGGASRPPTATCRRFPTRRDHLYSSETSLNAPALQDQSPPCLPAAAALLELFPFQGTTRWRSHSPVECAHQVLRTEDARRFSSQPNRFSCTAGRISMPFFTPRESDTTLYN